MLRTHLIGQLASAVLALAPVQAPAQSASAAAGGAWVEQVRGRTLAISFYGDPTDPAVTYVWDFRADGSLCARLIGAPRGDKCAEEGTWTSDENFLCWELPAMGRALGTNPACTSVLRTAPERYELRNKKAPDLKFATVMVLR